LVAVNIQNKLRSRIMGGFFAILPLFLTFAIVRFILEFVSGFTRPLLNELSNRIVSEEYRGQFLEHQNLVTFPLSVVLAVGIIYIIGFWAEKGLRQLFERGITKLPLIASLYSSIRQVVDVLGSSDDKKGMFERVCLFKVNEGSAEILGFMTSVFSDEKGQKFATLYVPMPPNPTSGILYVAPLSLIRRVSLPADAAMKMIISGGLLTPAILKTTPVNGFDS
jgi:uncharacterized membrane protein